MYVLRNAPKLKTNEYFRSVYLVPDRTKETGRLHSGLVEQMKELIKQDNSERYFVRDNKLIVSVRARALSTSTLTCYQNL